MVPSCPADKHPARGSSSCPEEPDSPPRHAVPRERKVNSWGPLRSKRRPDPSALTKLHGSPITLSGHHPPLWTSKGRTSHDWLAMSSCPQRRYSDRCRGTTRGRMAQDASILLLVLAAVFGCTRSPVRDGARARKRRATSSDLLSQLVLCPNGVGAIMNARGRRASRPPT